MRQGDKVTSEFLSQLGPTAGPAQLDQSAAKKKRRNSVNPQTLNLVCYNKY